MPNYNSKDSPVRLPSMLLRSRGAKNGWRFGKGAFYAYYLPELNAIALDKRSAMMLTNRSERSFDQHYAYARISLTLIPLEQCQAIESQWKKQQTEPSENCPEANTIMPSILNEQTHRL